LRTVIAAAPDRSLTLQANADDSCLLTRALRDFTVPTGTPRCPAISAKLYPSTYARRTRARSAGGNCSTASRTIHATSRWSADDASSIQAISLSGSGVDRGRRESRRRPSMHTRRVICANHGPIGRLASNVPAARHAFRNACCTASAAASRSPSIERATEYIALPCWRYT
jgi:hypothetical protein